MEKTAPSENTKQPEIKIGDIIEFEWHGKMVKGKVIKLDPLTVI